MDLYQDYGLRRVINAYDKATTLGGARVPSAVADVVMAGLPDVFELSGLQDAAGRTIAETTGAEWGCVTNCAAAAISLGVAATMAGSDMGRIAQLPDTSGMPSRILIQKGHCISFGAPVTQMIRLTGADIVEVGHANRCSARQIEHALAQDQVSAIVAVESYHTVDYNGVKLPELVEIADEAGVPLVVDAATQELRFAELVASGPSLVSCSAQKYFCSTTAGIVAGRKDLVRAVDLQHSGIGRGMKPSKEGILGAIAALRASQTCDVEAWSRRESAKIDMVVSRLGKLPGIVASVSPDPNGCPFARARIELDPSVTGQTADSLRLALLSGDPAIYVRVYKPAENAIYINATEMTEAEVDVVCERVAACL